MIKEVFVEGVRIQLTPTQLKRIKKEVEARKRYAFTFVRMLTRFGFVKIKDVDDAYDHLGDTYDFYSSQNPLG